MNCRCAGRPEAACSTSLGLLGLLLRGELLRAAYAAFTSSSTGFRLQEKQCTCALPAWSRYKCKQVQGANGDEGLTHPRADRCHVCDACSAMRCRAVSCRVVSCCAGSGLVLDCDYRCCMCTHACGQMRETTSDVLRRIPHRTPHLSVFWQLHHEHRVAVWRPLQGSIKHAPGHQAGWLCLDDQQLPCGHL